MALQQAARVGSRLVVKLNLDDIDDLFGCVAAATSHCEERKDRRALDAVCDRLRTLLDEFTDDAPVAESPVPSLPSHPRVTARQAEYLAFIHLYTKLHRTPPAEVDFQRHFKVTPPTVHTMILTLERHGLIDRTPGQARSIQIRISAAALPDLL